MKQILCRTGYLFAMEKKALGTTWQKCYCQYIRENRWGEVISIFISNNIISIFISISISTGIRNGILTIISRFISIFRSISILCFIVAII